jgi:fructokinase
MAAGRQRIGIDLGGTKIEIAVLDRSGAIIARERRPAPQGNYAATIEAIRRLVEDVAGNNTSPVGVAMPGAISPASGLVKNANSTWLNGKPFDRDLAQALNRPVRVANDANCFTLSEAVDGAARDYPVVFGIIAGTGVGGGLTIGKKVHTGPHAIAGEWGHNPLPWPHADAGELEGPLCYCGKHGCIETWLSGPGLAADHARITGESLDAPAIAAAAQAGDDGASATLARYYDRFARALAHVINILDPDAVVLGGGLSNIDTLYTEVPKRLGAYVFSDVCATPVLRNMHGDSGGVRGAAWLWNDNDE